MLQSQISQTARERLAEAAVAKKAREDLSWEQVAEGAGLSVEFVTAAVLGQHPLPRSAAETVGKRLGLGEDDVLLLQSVPVRGSLGTTVPTDPTLYRFYEIMQVYGSTLKALVHPVRRRHHQRDQLQIEHREDRRPGWRASRRHHARWKISPDEALLTAQGSRTKHTSMTHTDPLSAVGVPLRDSGQQPGRRPRSNAGGSCSGAGPRSNRSFQPKQKEPRP